MSTSRSRVAKSPIDVLVVAPNAAVDVYSHLETLDVGNVNRLVSSCPTAGGKGNNLARALSRLGGQPMVTGFVAGQRGHFIREQLGREGIAHDYVEISGESRLSMTVISSVDQATTVFLEPGCPMPVGGADRLVNKVSKLSRRANWVVLTGSLLPGTTSEFYADVVQKVRGATSARLAVDASGEPLRLAAFTGPTLLKVNEEEYRSAFGERPRTVESVERLFQTLAADGLQVLCVTAGKRGALLVSKEECFCVRTEVNRVVCSAGAGDSFLAGILVELNNGQKLCVAARLASAAAAANLQTTICGDIHPRTVAEFLPLTRICDPSDFFEEVA
jgi:1-phosphofructokinase family hexose kinase